MTQVSPLKLRLTFATTGTLFLLITLFYFIKHDLTTDLPFYVSAGSIFLSIIICGIMYGYIFSDIRRLRAHKLQVISRGFNVLPTATTGLIFLLATILFLVFVPHVMVASIGFSCIMFTLTLGIRLTIFDHTDRTVTGLIRDKVISFDNLQVVSEGNGAIELKELDAGQTTTIKRENLDASKWAQIVNNCLEMNGQ